MGERFRVRFDGFDLGDGGSGQAEKGVAHLHQVLPHDRNRLVIFIAGQSVEHRQHTAGRRVLHREHQSLDVTCFQRGKTGNERRQSDGVTVGIHLDGRTVAVGVGLTLVADFHAARLIALGRFSAAQKSRGAWVDPGCRTSVRWERVSLSGRVPEAQNLVRGRTTLAQPSRSTHTDRESDVDKKPPSMV